MLKVHLTTIKTPKHKLRILYEKALSHFHLKDPLFILCADERSCHFVDEVLWGFCQEAFLPHVDILKDPLEMITFGLSCESFTGKTIFNLKNELPQDAGKFSLIYDFEDLTSPEKEKASRLRYKEYKSLGSEITCYTVS